ncbi:MAG: RagB/SusD family nutrient uptake outer membrane protein [Bacteroidaceae bacterium]|nr:RagB/SusD family nutrient uptake outer membrane protein [Prevotella sp.]MBO7602750.1 RagB/SusD family nutrient uptake outer membrane protein [Bacteroidaceae bacterium]
MTEESAYAHGLLIFAYERLPYMRTTQTDVATDDAVTNVTTNAYLTMASGTWASDNDPLSQWDNCKHGIQYANLFLSLVEKVKWAPSAVSKQQMFIDRMKGEAFGLRAVFYYYLLQAHSGYADDGILYGVPLLTVAEDGSSDFNQARATFADCVKQIFADCDSAIALLPDHYEDLKTEEESLIPAKYQALGANVSGYNLVFGQKSMNLMSGKAAQAIKAQVALLAVSPAFRDQSGVTSAEAATYCASALKSIGGMEGFDPTGNIWYRNKTKLDPKASEMSEILWRPDRSNDNDQERENFPPTLYGSGRVNPSQNLVDAFPMRNGRPITDPLSGYDPQNPYTNRDPRLDDIVIYHGAVLKGTTILTGVDMPNDNNETIDNLNNIGTSTRTGYYLRKLLRDDVSANPSAQSIQYHVYPRIRSTEIFLAYAEAANDAWGPDADPTGIGFTAYDVIKAIRGRAGLGKDEYGLPLPEGDAYLEECKSDKEKMTQLIRNERRIELCFENKRFWDLRRWQMPLDEGVKGMKIEKVDPNKDDSPLQYTIIQVEDRVFNSSYQWYGPIPKEEMLKWSNLKQNKGWQ